MGTLVVKYRVSNSPCLISEMWQATMFSVKEVEDRLLRPPQSDTRQALETKKCDNPRQKASRGTRPLSQACATFRRRDKKQCLARTPTRKRWLHSTVYECLKAFLRHTSIFLKRSDTMSTNAQRSLRQCFDTLAFLKR